MSLLTRSCLITLTALSLSACLVEVGNGEIVTQTRTVPAFSRVAVQSGLHATLSQGERSVAFITDQNLQTFLQAYVEDDTLVLRVVRNFSLQPTANLGVIVTNDVLEGLEVSGGAQVSANATPAADWSLTASGGSTVTLSQLQTQRLVIEASGGSRVTAFGLAPHLSATGSGGSQVNTEGTSAEDVIVQATGGSIFHVRASKSVSGAASGGSQVTVSGNPAARTITATGGSLVTWISNE